jgi:hypothetical protein
MIDEALASAKSRLNSGVPQMTKVASTGDPLVKEAAELADALEYIAYSSGNTGSISGAIRGDMVKSFFKTATEGSPAQSSAQATGTQEQPPSEGAKKLNPKGLVAGASPAQSSAQPEAKDGEKKLLESMKQAEGTSLYDILMNNKEAGEGGPAESTASDAAPDIPSGNENTNRQALLGSNTAPENATKQQAKAPVRARLAELFANTGQTGEASAKAAWPQAAAKGGLKTASVGERLSAMEEAPNE